MRKTITAAIAVLLIASCQQETSSEPVSVPETTSTVATSSTTTTPPDSTTTMAASTSTTAATTTTAAVPPPDADPFPPDELVGTWHVATSYLTFYEGGALDARESPEDTPYERGTWEIDGAILSVASDPGGMCNPEIIGRYWIRWAEDRSRILATTIEDSCTRREPYARLGYLPVTED